MESVIARPAGAGGSTRLDVEETSQIGAARRQASALGHAHALDTDAVGRLAIVVTEAATNLVRHGGGGMIVLRALHHGGGPAIEVLALDKGSGISNVDRAMEDGYSSAGTAGHGLGAMRRLSDVFAVHSRRDVGTAVLARVAQRQHSAVQPARAAVLDDRLGAVCVPMRGEVECGDRWELVTSRDAITLMLVDGLGHGPEAAVAAASAAHAFAGCAQRSEPTVLSVLDAEMRETRGAAVSVVHVDEAAAAVSFTGVGNVEARVLGGESTQYLVPQNGIVGHGMPAVRSMPATWVAGGRLIMNTDGVAARWRLDAYENAAMIHPALLAGMLYRDFARERDDVTVIVFAHVARQHA
jgi:anti-sigma regulatory factor (Ser/Thr protein kinase)